MKRFMTRIIVCLVPTIISLIVVYWAYAQYQNGRGGFTLGVDLAGGTILVYEVDESKTTEDYKPEELAAALKRRIDPADLFNITIRPIGKKRVEIILPTGGRHQAEAEQRNWNNLLEAAGKKYAPDKENPFGELRRGNIPELIDQICKMPDYKDKRVEVSTWVDQQWNPGGRERRMLTGDEVENIKNLIAKQGRLEFCILANTNDDQAAIDAARKSLKNASKEQLDRLEIRAEPPPPPVSEIGSRTFPVNIPNEPEHVYRWVEVGKSQLYSLRMNTDARGSLPTDDGMNANAAIERCLKSNEPFLLHGNLYYARKITEWSRRNKRDEEMGKRYEIFVLVRDPLKSEEITGDYLASASPGNYAGKLIIQFSFTPEGGQRFFTVTSKNKPDGNFQRQLAIIFDGQVASAPSLQSAISDRGQITGNFTMQEVNDMVRILRAGALPTTLKKDPVSENSMGPTLGADTIWWGSVSVVGAFIAVLLFMMWYYRFAGVVACIALFCNLIFTVAFMVLVQAAFTLPGLAGLVLTLGMAVDANVLIYERLREERDRGADLRLALRNGYDRAFPTILDTHLSSIFTAIVLYIVGNDQLKGFGISLTVGLIISLFTSLYMTRTMFEIWLAKGWMKQLSFYEGLVKLVHIRYWDFMSIRQYFFTATVILTVLGGVLFIWRADPTSKTTVLNIDFTGGVAFTGQLNEPMDLETLRQDLEDPKLLPDLSIDQIFVTSDEAAGAEKKQGYFSFLQASTKSRFFTVRTSNRDDKAVLTHITTSLKGKLKKVNLKDYALKVNDKKNVTSATLNFASEKGETDYASQAQVKRLLTSHIPDSAFDVEPAEKAKEKDERFSALLLKFSEPIGEKEVRTALAAFQTEFNSQPQPERLEVFDSQLALNTQQRALYAILASWCAILLYLWFRFGNWTFGAAAVICLIHDLFFTLGVIAACHYIHGTPIGYILGIQDFKIDLPAVAALLTLVGYSVNDTIVVFDRIREVRGKSPMLTTKMINDSVNQTLTRTILASATTFLVVLVLYVIGGEGVKLFAFVMIVGIIVGTYSSIYIASPLLLVFGEGRTGASHQQERVPATTPAIEG